MVDAERLGKLEQLKKLKINPYPGAAVERIEIKQVCDSFSKLEGKKVSVAGRLMSIREHGKLAFADLEDFSGRIQLWLAEDSLGKKQYELLKLLERGDFVNARGVAAKTKRGEMSVKASEIKILAKALRNLPSEWFGLKDTENRYRQRYVDIILNKSVRDVFLKRCQILREMRAYLDEHGYVEVETPIIQSAFGGAAAKPFKTYINDLKQEAYLRISDELYLKRLIAGGFEKVYEVSKDFRNESIDSSHNPEFTQIEFYEAYADYEKLMKMTEEMMSRIIKKVNNNSLKVKYGDVVLDFTMPLKRVKFRDVVLKETGVDIDKENTEEKLKKAMRAKKLAVDLKGVVGYGALADELYKKYVRPKLIQPCFLLDYPAELIPLAKRKDDNPAKIATFQLLANSFELVKAYNELNDPIDQKKRFEEQLDLEKKGLGASFGYDGDFVRALEYGMPPTAGWGCGIDRLTMVLTNQQSIKEVILFPFMGLRNDETKTPKDV